MTTLGIRALMMLCALWMGMLSGAWAQPLPERLPLSGRLTRPDGAPVKGATVTLQRENDLGSFAFWGASTVSDANGNFSFPDAEADNYFLSVEAAGYAPLQSRAFTLNAASQNTRLTLLPLVALRLKLFKPDGALLTGSAATLRLDTENAASRTLRRATDAGGEINLRDQLPGRTRIHIVAPGNGYAALEKVLAGAAGTTQTTEVHLQSGGALRVTAREDKPDGRGLGGALLSLNPVVQITNEDRAQGRLPSPVEGALQGFYSNNRDGATLVTRDGDGALDISDLRPGRYAVRLTLPGFAPSSSREIDVLKDAQSQLDFVFATSTSTTLSSLRVRLQNKDGAPLANRDFNIQLRSLRTAANGDIAPPFPPDLANDVDAAVVRVPGILLRRARSDAEGTLTLFPIPLGRWRLSVFESNGATAERRGPVFQGEVGVTNEGGEINFVEGQSSK